jgi:hypothetical protein
MSSSVLERQQELIRAMSPEQKIRAAEALYRVRLLFRDTAS